MPAEFIRSQHSITPATCAGSVSGSKPPSAALPSWVHSVKSVATSATCTGRRTRLADSRHGHGVWVFIKPERSSTRAALHSVVSRQETAVAFSGTHASGHRNQPARALARSLVGSGEGFRDVHHHPDRGREILNCGKNLDGERLLGHSRQPLLHRRGDRAKINLGGRPSASPARVLWCTAPPSWPQRVGQRADLGLKIRGGRHLSYHFRRYASLPLARATYLEL